jgi:hypothetical protein
MYEIQPEFEVTSGLRVYLGGSIVICNVLKSANPVEEMSSGRYCEGDVVQSANEG